MDAVRRSENPDGDREGNRCHRGDVHEHSDVRETIVNAAGWRIVLLASLGGTLEFYDFVIFGIFARDIADAVFPSGSPLVSLMASFAAFAAGYLARPIGGIVLSHYGDRHGRRRVFLWSVFVMSARDDRHGARADVRAMGRGGERADGGAADCAGLLPRRRTARRADLRRRNGAGYRAVCLRCRVRVRHDGRGRGDRGEPVGAHAAGAGGLPILGWRIAFVHRRPRRRPELRVAAVARRVAGIRAHAEPGVTAAVSASCCRRMRRPSFVGCAVLAGTACFNGLFFSHLPAYLSSVLHYDAAPGRLLADGRRHRLVRSGSSPPAGWAIAFRRAICCDLASTLLLVLAYPFYAALDGAHAST